jgi:hypothetical protein
MWHLMDDKNYYLGRLRMANNKWVFDAPDKVAELADLAEFFGECLADKYSH